MLDKTREGCEKVEMFRCANTDCIATGCGDNAVRVFRQSTEFASSHEFSLDLLCSVRSAHAQDVNCVSWNRAVAGLLATAGDDCLVKLWQWQN